MPTPLTATFLDLARHMRPEELDLESVAALYDHVDSGPHIRDGINITLLATCGMGMPALRSAADSGRCARCLHAPHVGPCSAQFDTGGVVLGCYCADGTYR